MKEDDIRRLFGQGGSNSKPPPSRPKIVVAQKEAPQAAYEGFHASELYCPKCKQAMPTKERHLLYLPNGDLYDYSCPRCGTSLGSRKTGGG